MIFQRRWQRFTSWALSKACFQLPLDNQPQTLKHEGHERRRPVSRRASTLDRYLIMCPRCRGPMNQRRLFVASCVALIATAMTFAIRGDIMSDFERDFGLTKTDVGWIAGAAFWGFGLSILVGGPLCDLLGMGTLLRLAAAG